MAHWVCWREGDGEEGEEGELEEGRNGEMSIWGRVGEEDMVVMVREGGVVGGGVCSKRDGGRVCSFLRMILDTVQVY